MSLDGAEARGVRQPPGADVAQSLDLHYRRLRVREPLPVAEFRLPVPAKDLEDFLPHLGMVLQIVCGIRYTAYDGQIILAILYV